MTSTTTYHHSDNAEKYREKASYVYSDEYTREVLKLLDAQPGEMILDVGCGSGELTKRIHSIVNTSSDERQGKVYAIDVSSSMIGAAKEWNPGPEYNVCDGHELLSWLKENDLIGKFDKVFSNAALHWMIQSPSAVVEGMSAALKPSGTLAIEMGGSLNVIGLRSALHSSLARRGIDPVKVDPWYFPSPATYSNLIEKSGLRVNVAYLYARLTPLPNGLQGFLETFAGPFINALPSDTDKIDFMREVEEQVKVDMYDSDSEQWTLMNVRLRVQATKP